jgi:hypothetical protein
MLGKPTLPALDREGKPRGLRAVHHASDVDVELPPPRLRRHLACSDHLHDAGIVDPAADGPKARSGADSVGKGRRFRDVGADREGPRRRGVEPQRGFVSRCLVPIEKRD